MKNLQYLIHQARIFSKALGALGWAATGHAVRLKIWHQVTQVIKVYSALSY